MFDPNADFDPSESEYGNGLFLLLTLPTRYPHLLLCGSIKVPKILNIILHLAQFGNILYNILRCQYKTLSAFDTAHLLEDAFSLAYAGQLDCILVMNMMKYLKRGKHPIPWCVASSKLIYIYTLLKDGSIFPNAFVRYAGDLVDSTYREIGWELKGVRR